jgi:hypothetical protein
VGIGENGSGLGGVPPIRLASTGRPRLIGESAMMIRIETASADASLEGRSRAETAGGAARDPGSGRDAASRSARVRNGGALTTDSSCGENLAMVKLVARRAVMFGGKCDAAHRTAANAPLSDAL